MSGDDVTWSENGYRYKDLPLTPASFAELLVELCSLDRLPSPFQRSVAIRAVESAHLARGGVPSRSAGSQLFKKASIRLRSDGVIESRSHGFWEFRAGNTGSQLREGISEGENPNVVDAVLPELLDVPTSVARSLTVLEERGAGAGAVYVYFSPSDLELAKLKDQTRWPCKVGYTVEDFRLRILSQISTTATHTLPTVGLVIHTNHAREMEVAIHAVLKASGLQMRGGGAEWFSTSPDEVGEIAAQFEMLVEGLLSQSKNSD